MTDHFLRVFSLFSSIQGESTSQGRPCFFVRLAGCPLSCSYCDTLDARESPGRPMGVEQALSAAEDSGLRLVEVTGGEPLAQPATVLLLSSLADAGFDVLLETSGAFPVRDLDPKVRVVLDLKTPGSGMFERMHIDNYDSLVPGRHELKIVVTSREDFDWGLRFVRDRGIEGRVETLFSPAAGLVQPADLASWMLDASCRGRLQLQIHRVIWPSSQEQR